MSETINYYNSSAADFFDSTVNADMSAQYNLFEKYLYPGACILDCGCGSGRDTKYFLEQGYEVTAIDGSEELCKKASELTGINVENKFFQDINYENKFDGIWACASLLHVSKDELEDIVTKLKKAMLPRGILYISFKYGEFTGDRNGRFFTDLNEEGLEAIIAKVGGLTVQEIYIYGDARPRRENEKWLNAIVVKKEETALKTKDELAETEKLKGEIVIDGKSHRVLKITRALSEIDFMSSLDQLAQYVNIANIVNTIEKGVEYVVQIPAQYQQQFETGEYFINKNKATGIEWPTLMKKADNGRYQFVDNLPIQQQEMIKGNPFQDMCNSYHNIVMQKQLAQIAETVANTYESVRMIEVGQQDDRIALIESGKEEILLAMTLQDENEKREHMRLGAHDLLLGKKQIGNALKRRVEAFKALPESEVARFFLSLAKPGYLSKKDDEVDTIQECYSMYIEATKMLVATFAYTGETAAVEQTFRNSVEFLKGIDFTSIKSIGLSHKGTDLSDWFFNKPTEYIEVEEAPFLEFSKGYDYVQIEVSGEELLEVFDNGGKTV